MTARQRLRPQKRHHKYASRETVRKPNATKNFVLKHNYCPTKHWKYLSGLLQWPEEALDLTGEKEESYVLWQQARDRN